MSRLVNIKPGQLVTRITKMIVKLSKNQIYFLQYAGKCFPKPDQADQDHNTSMIPYPQSTHQQFRTVANGSGTYSVPGPGLSQILSCPCILTGILLMSWVSAPSRSHVPKYQDKDWGIYPLSGSTFRDHGPDYQDGMQ